MLHLLSDVHIGQWHWKLEIEYVVYNNNTVLMENKNVPNLNSD